MTNIQSLEQKVSHLVEAVSAKREVIQQGDQISRLQALLAEIDKTLASADGVIPDSAAEIAELKQQRRTIEEELRDIEVAAPLPAFDYALHVSESLSTPSDSTLINPATLANGSAGKRAIQSTGVVLLLLLTTLGIGSLRVANSIRQGPYLSNPVIPGDDASRSYQDNAQ